MNVSALKTPGVYINEINAFPPSVAQVSTVPAFVGYTHKHVDAVIKINSFIEFENIFGNGPSPKKVVVELDDFNNITSNSYIEESIFKLYNSLQLFYANGGGVCYIASIGTYYDNGGQTNALSLENFIKGLEKLSKIDEPSIIAFPDAIGLNTSDLGTLQQQALLQCELLKDRFVILDVKELTDPNKSNLDISISTFREAIGNNNLKYGAAYYPQLITNFPVNLQFKNIEWRTSSNGNFDNIIANANNTIKLAYTNLKSLITDSDTLKNEITNSNIQTTINITDALSLQATFDSIIAWLQPINNANNLNNAAIKSLIDETIKNALNNYLKSIQFFKTSYDAYTDDEGEDLTDINTNFTSFTNTNWTAIGASYDNINSPYKDSLGADNKIDWSRTQAAMQQIASNLGNSISSLHSKLDDLYKHEEQNFVALLPFYKNVVQYLSTLTNTLPCSGAMAGIYANTDKIRGIWKAPANISINAILGLTDDINDAEQEDMNIHTTGKSINAVRKFTGKGLLVWGARTLDGNSNDWRYINVRRLAIMIEESVKNACLNFVFEPNVSQTWVNVKGMIENYMTLLWNDGALAGSKPEHAYFVQIGLNQTMTPQDILEGRMVVKIGYAPSRPAEFIIIEFKQMQQRS